MSCSIRVLIHEMHELGIEPDVRAVERAEGRVIGA